LETKASAKYIRVSSRKARLVVDLIRGKDVADAQQILEYSPKAAARVVSKILNSAIANAEHNNGLNADELFVSRAFVDEGPTLKRFRPRAMGRATRINKRTSHITLVLDEREPRGEAKRRRFRRPVRRKAAPEPEVLEGELEEEEIEATESAPEAPQDEVDQVELDADVEAAPQAPRDEDEQEELNAEVEAEETVEAEAEEAPKPAKKTSRKTAKPGKAKKADAADKTESETDAGADDSGSED
jgi:large subunit ribosomal protein L22